MSELKDQYQRPEGRLIEQALKTPPKKSVRKLAGEVGLSEGRARQIINGYQSMGGQIIAIVGPADTVGRLAQAAGVTPEQMRAAGREDAADEMHPLRAVGVTEDGDLWLSDHEEEEAELLGWLNTPQSERERPPTRALALWDAEQLLEAAIESHRDEVRLLNYMVNTLSTRPSLAKAQAMEGFVRDHGGDPDTLGGSLSEPADTSDDAIAAHEEETPIVGEQEESDTP